MPVPPERHWWIRLRIWIAEIWTIEAPRIAADTVLSPYGYPVKTWPT
jgi:hypothetical protein